MGYAYLSWFRNRCCKALVPSVDGTNLPMANCLGLPVVEMMILLIHISIVLNATIVGLSCVDGFGPGYAYNIGFLVYGTLRLIAVSKIIVIMCRMKKIPVYVAMGITAAEIAIAIGLMYLGVAQLHEYVSGGTEEATPRQSNGTSDSPTTTPAATTGTKVLLSFICILLIVGIAELIVEFVAMCRFRKYLGFLKPFAGEQSSLDRVPHKGIVPATTPMIPPPPPQHPPPPPYTPQRTPYQGLPAMGKQEHMEQYPPPPSKGPLPFEGPPECARCELHCPPDRPRRPMANDSYPPPQREQAGVHRQYGRY